MPAALLLLQEGGPCCHVSVRLPLLVLLQQLLRWML
jgi:hypothetical protein